MSIELLSKGGGAGRVKEEGIWWEARLLYLLSSRWIAKA
jgi:hypothetical protein